MRLDQFQNLLAETRFESGDEVNIANPDDPMNPLPVTGVTRNRFGIIIHAGG